MGYPYGEADTLEHLGQAYTACGQHDQARDAWRQALQLYQAQHRTDDTQRIQHHLDGHSEPGDEQAEVPDWET